MRQIHIQADNLHFPMFEFEFYKIISTNNRISLPLPPPSSWNSHAIKFILMFKIFILNVVLNRMGKNIF